MEIEIDITDLLAYARIAHVLDQDEFMDRVNAIRKSWGLNNFVPYQNFEDWLKEPHIDFSFTSEAAKVLESAKERFETDTTHKNMTPYEELGKNKQLSEVRVIEYELEYTLHKLNLNLNLKPILLKAIVCNKVKKKDLSDEKKIFEGKYKDWIFDDLYYGYKPKTGTKLDTKSEITRDRQWYWLHKSGKSYLQIAKVAKERGVTAPNLFKSNVVIQIKRYEQFLCINI